MPTAAEIEEAADSGHYQHPVRAVPLGPPSEAQLELIRAQMPDPSILDEREPFVWQVHASNDREDSFATRMHRSTLERFAADATEGVAFMNSHRTGGFIGSAELPMGHTFEGRLIGASAAGPLRVEITSYTLRGLNLTGLSTDQFIDGLRSGIARDVSIGFKNPEYRCSICDRMMFADWECRHWPGREYPKLDSKGNETGETVRAVAWIHNANLSEVSAVFDGATPGCMVSKARRMAEAGEIRAETIDWLEQRYRINLPRPSRSFAGADIPPPAEEAVPMLTDEQIAQVRLALTSAGQPPDADIVTAVQTVVDEARAGRAQAAEIERLRPFEDEATRLRPLADEGRAYRADLIAATLAEGARAFGEAFSEETYRALLEAAPLETVKRMQADWKTAGDALFKPGRVTQDTPADQPVEISGRRRRVPAAARG